MAGNRNSEARMAAYKYRRGLEVKRDSPSLLTSVCVCLFVKRREGGCLWDSQIEIGSHEEVPDHHHPVVCLWVA